LNLIEHAIFYWKKCRQDMSDFIELIQRKNIKNDKRVIQYSGVLRAGAYKLKN
jgi:hypothetical protein